MTKREKREFLERWQQSQEQKGLAAQVSPYVLALSVDDTCKALGIGRTLLYQLVAAGRLRSFQIAGRRLFQKSELEAFLVREASNAA